MADSPGPISLVGLVRLRDHCTFEWWRLDVSTVKNIEIREHHCLQCLAEARRRGYRLLTQDGKEYPA
jgi:hypothetical protein